MFVSAAFVSAFTIRLLESHKLVLSGFYQLLPIIKAVGIQAD
jgi:hypothetical protein